MDDPELVIKELKTRVEQAERERDEAVRALEQTRQQLDTARNESVKTGDQLSITREDMDPAVSRTVPPQSNKPGPPYA